MNVDEATKQAQIEQMWKERAENKLIEIYVPEAPYLSHAEALKVALERDANAAQELIDSFNSVLKLDAAVNLTRTKMTLPKESPEITAILRDLGF